MNAFNLEELESLAAGYVLDDLNEAEMMQVEELIQTSPAMREQIRQSLSVMGMLTADVEPISPPASLKDKIKLTFDRDNVPRQSLEKTIVNLENWFQEIFAAGWQTATELLETPSLAPAFRSTGVEGGILVSIGSDITPIILVVRVIQTSTSDRDVAVEILPKLKSAYLPHGLQLILLDADGDAVMEATTREQNKNLKFDFAGTSGEVFSIKLELRDRVFQEDFIL